MTLIKTIGSDLRDLVRMAYRDYINSAQDIPEDLKRALKAHERIPVFVDNLAKEFRTIEKHDHRFKGRPLTRNEIIETVQDFTKVFISNVKRQADERQMSDLAKQAILDQESKVKEMAELTDAMTAEENTDEEVHQTKEGFEISKATHVIDELP